jgi:hypothetical protein
MFALQSVKTEPHPAWVYNHAHAIFLISWYIVAGVWLVLIVALALGLQRQHHSALRLLHTLVPVLLAQALISVASNATEGWMLWLAFPSEIPQPALWWRLFVPVGHLIALIWLLSAYRPFAQAADNEPQARTWGGVSVAAIMAWLWVLLPVQELWQRVTFTMPMLLSVAWYSPATTSRLMSPVIGYLIVSFFMVRDGVKVLQHDHEALLPLSRSILGVVILSAAATVFFGYQWYQLASTAPSGTWSIGMMPGLALALKWLLLSVVSLLVLRQRKQGTLFEEADE